MSDETPKELQPRKVTSSALDGGGYRVKLDGCGHEILSAVEPPPSMICAVCLQEKIDEIRLARRTTTS